MARPALAATWAVDIINFMAANPAQSYSLSELVNQVGLNFSSCEMLLNVLANAGYLERDPRCETYMLGATLITIGNEALKCHQTTASAYGEDLKSAT